MISRAAFAASAALLLAACGAQRYEDLGAFIRAQEDAGFVRLGSFGDVEWPAEVVDERTSPDSIQFTEPGGTPRDYTGFDGYTLKVVRLKGRKGREMALVFRSKTKR